MAVPLLRSPTLLAVPGLRHGLSTRIGGVSGAPFESLNLGRSTGDDAADVAQNHERLARVLGFDTLATLRQVHGAEIHDAAAAQGGGLAPEADGWFVDQPGQCAGVLGADCPGVLLVAPDRKALVLLHAGWKGIASGIIAAGVARLEGAGASPSSVLAVLGVGIGKAAYEVDTPVLDAIAKSLALSVEALDFATTPTRPGHAHLDLHAVIGRQLEEAGVPPEQIDALDGCTFEETSRFYSHRRDGTEAGRHALVAGWDA